MSGEEDLQAYLEYRPYLCLYRSPYPYGGGGHTTTTTTTIVKDTSSRNKKTHQHIREPLRERAGDIIRTS